MSDRLPGLIVLAIGGSIAPPLLLLTILFLGSQRPLPNATALALGYFATCAAMGILGLTLFGGAGSTASAVGRVISAMVGGLLIVLGLISCVCGKKAKRETSLLGLHSPCFSHILGAHNG